MTIAVKAGTIMEHAEKIVAWFDANPGRDTCKVRLAGNEIFTVKREDLPKFKQVIKKGNNMGADLYIQELFKPSMRKYKPAFKRWCKKRDVVGNSQSQKTKDKIEAKIEFYYHKMYSQGYFRDSYNVSSVMLTLGLSWSQYVKRGMLEGSDLRQFRDAVEMAKQELPTLQRLQDLGAGEDDTLEEWHTYFIEKRRKLLEFLDVAITNGWKVEVSY